MRYAAYGLIIDSEIAMPGLTQSNRLPQVTIRLARVAKPPGEAGAARTLSSRPGELCVHWRGVGTYLLQRGCEIWVDPAPEAEEALTRLYLFGPALAYLMHQRGLLVLHASVVSVEGVAVGFLGERGWGKSTTAAALNARGHALVADDILAIQTGLNGVPMVQPGPPHFKLWPEAAAASFGDDPDQLRRLHSQVEKRTRLATNAVGKSQALRHLYVLDRGEDLEVAPVAPAEALLSLIRHTYLSGLIKSLGGLGGNFRQCAELTRQVSICSLKRPKDLAALSSLVDLVENDMSRRQHLDRNCALAAL